jgi:hypothetical protein
VLRISKRPEPVNLVHCSSCNRHEPFCYSCRHRPTPKNTLRGNPGCAVGPKTPTKAAPGLQRGRPESGCNGNTTPINAGAIHHRGAVYLGRTQESPRGCRSPTGRKLSLPKARVPSEHRATTSRLMREASVHTGRTRDATPAAPDRLGNEHHRRDRRARLDEKVRRGYHPRRGGRYDSEEDQSPSPEPPDPQAFSRAIRRAPFSTRFRARLPSPSTRGKQGQSCGLRTTGWHASWEERTTTTSSSATSPCSSPTPPGPGWSIFLLRRSPTGMTRSRPSLETSRARTCALGTPGTSEAAASSQGNPCESTSGGFQSSAPSCPTSLTRMSSGRSSPAPLAAT